LATAQPETAVSVIVQKSAADSQAEAQAAALGGTVTQDLHLINAFAANMTAASAVRLAADPHVRWISLNGAVARSGRSSPSTASPCTTCNVYLNTLNVQPVWQMGLTGAGIGVAVIDSGISSDADFSGLSQRMSFNKNSNTVNDVNGHGTHVAGIIGGNGAGSNGLYKGVAPGVALYGLKISDETGMAYESDAVAAMQWVLENKVSKNIRVVNLSFNATTEGSYHLSPMNAAAEILWFNGIVVVTSAGNKGAGGNANTTNAAPANDPFLITVGASDEKYTPSSSDDNLAPYSAYGITLDGFSKPDIVAPGSNIYSVLSKDSPWKLLYPERTALNNEYFRLSGTSMAAPMVTGAVALLLQNEPNLTPDQVKYRLTQASGRSLTWYDGSGKNRITYSIPYLNVQAVVAGTTTQSANTGLVPSQLLWTGSTPVTWTSVAWNSVAWNSVAWNSVAWNSVAWNSVAWNSVAWNN
jgi:serine protease AprX